MRVANVLHSPACPARAGLVKDTDAITGCSEGELAGHISWILDIYVIAIAKQIWEGQVSSKELYVCKFLAMSRLIGWTCTLADITRMHLGAHAVKFSKALGIGFENSLYSVPTFLLSNLNNEHIHIT